MLIVSKHTGQLCNRIWSLLPLISYLEHTKSKALIFYAREDYVNLFPALRTYCHIKWLLFSDLPHTLFYKSLNFLFKTILKWIPILNCSIREIKNFGLYAIDGWEYRHDASYIREEKLTILQIFAPSLKVQKKVRSTLRSFDGLTVGVHIRRGDYKEWCNGKYYYSDNVYIRIMHDLASEAKRIGKNIRFLICSNERFDIDQVNLHTLQIPNSDGITDLYALSQCDFIVAPPSSYSQWASFYGSVPLSVVLESTQKVEFDDFSSIEYLDTFANGNHLEFDEQHECFYINVQNRTCKIKHK